MSTHDHKKGAPRHLRIGILSVSSTRSLKEDKSGLWMAKRARKEGHTVVEHRMVRDDADQIAATLWDVMQEAVPDALLITGGTGIAAKDVTIEAVQPLLQKELTAFGTLFAQLSFEQIDSAALLSRATAGIIGKTVLFCMPGSLRACQLACKALIFPELGHLVGHLRKG